jgi:hypothetical protein
VICLLQSAGVNPKEYKLHIGGRELRIEEKCLRNYLWVHLASVETVLCFRK